MKRKAVILSSNASNTRHLAADSEIAGEIIEFLRLHPKYAKRFAYISERIIVNKTNSDLYGNEQIDEKSNGVTAIKFKGSDNFRIYCKEVTFSDNVTIIVMASIPHRKKNQKLKQKEKSIINRIADYLYDEESFEPPTN